VQGADTVNFHRESSKPLQFVHALYALELTNNLISLSTLEDKGYWVSFCKGKVFVRPLGFRKNMDKIIGVWEENVYRLQFEPARALVSTTSDMGEL